MLSSRLLNQFVAVAEELHFGRAAVRVHMAQSPLSQAIRRLEESLGVQLFVRTRRTVTMTPAGELLLQQARILLRAESSTISLLRHAQQFGTGRLSIGFVGNVAYGLVPRLLSAFRKSHSGIHLEIAEMLTRDQIRALGTGQLDAGIVRLPIRNATGLQSRVIDRDRFVLALPKDHRRTRRKAVRLGDLRDEPFVAYSQERVPVLHSASVALCLKEGFYPDIVCQAWQASSILSFVAAGVGLALIPSHLAVFRHDAVAYRPLLISPENDFALDIALIWRDGDVSPPLAAFIATVSAPRVRERSVVP